MKHHSHLNHICRLFSIDYLGMSSKAEVTRENYFAHDCLEGYSVHGNKALSSTPDLILNSPFDSEVK